MGEPLKVVKHSFHDLAVFGGSAAFQNVKHVGRPNIGDQEKMFERLKDIFNNRWLTNNGPYVQELEKRLADFLNVKHCLAICNATIGLEIAIRALGMEGEVILPSFTFVATAHALQWQGITPVFCDVDPATHNIDPTQIERLITPKTTGIIGVHTWGRSCDIEALRDIAQHHNLKLLFDAAHAFGNSYDQKMIGGFGDAEVFSFHATKFFNSFEGGLIATNDDGLAEQVRLIRNFGFVGQDQVIHVGTNGKMSEVSAAMGLTSFESMDEFVRINYENYLSYHSFLGDIPGVELVKYNECERNNYQYIVLEIDEKVSGISRDLLVKILHGENIRARRYFYPGCHEMEPYHSLRPDAGLLLPETEKLTSRVVQLPTGTAIDREDIEAICELIRFVISHSAEINEHGRAI